MQTRHTCSRSGSGSFAFDVGSAPDGAVGQTEAVTDPQAIVDNLVTQAIADVKLVIGRSENGRVEIQGRAPMVATAAVDHLADMLRP